MQQSNSFGDARAGVGDEDKSIKFIRQFSCSLLREDDSESIKLIAIYQPLEVQIVALVCRLCLHLL